MVNNILVRKKKKHEYNWREVECESCGCKVKKCHWLRHLGTKSIGMWLKKEGVGEIWGSKATGQGEKLNCTSWTITSYYNNYYHHNLYKGYVRENPPKRKPYKVQYLKLLVILRPPDPDKQGLNLYFYLPPCGWGSMDRTRALLPGEPHQASFRRSWQAQMARISGSNNVAAFCGIFLLRALYDFEKYELNPKTVKDKHVINTFQSVSSCQQRVRVLIIYYINTI